MGLGEREVEVVPGAILLRMSPTFGAWSATSWPRNTPVPLVVFLIAAKTNFAWAAANANSLFTAPACLTHQETKTADHGVLTPGNAAMPFQYSSMRDASGSSCARIR